MSDTLRPSMTGFIRDCDGTFGLDPSEQDLVCCGVEPACDIVDGLVHGTARLACDRAVYPHEPLLLGK